eukprot:4352285-Alexandrium_andersonii.AAC.1
MSSFKVDAWGGAALARLGSGCLQGDFNAPGELLDGFPPVVARWSAGTREQRRQFFNRCGMFGGLRDGSLFKFEDDLLQFLMSDRQVPDHQLEPAGYQQIHGKEEFAASLSILVAVVASGGFVDDM